MRVTNLSNGRSLIVRINDRGPFVDDRVIDLSKACAQRLGVIGAGTARVRIQSLSGIPQIRADGDVVGDYYVQVGAFGVKQNAQGLISKLTAAGYAGRLIFGSNNLWNVQVGPWPDTARAKVMRELLKRLYPHAFVVGGDNK